MKAFSRFKATVVSATVSLIKTVIIPIVAGTVFTCIIFHLLFFFIATYNEAIIAEAATITIDDNTDANISYETLVTDLSTGVEYRSETGEPVIIEATLGHQYSVVTTANVKNFTGTIGTSGHYLLGENGLTINYCFNDAGQSFTHTYTFILPKGTGLSYVKKSMFSNTSKTYLTALWTEATGRQGIVTDLSSQHPVNDGFLLKIVNNEERNNYRSAAYIAIFGIICLVGLIASTVGITCLRKRNQK